MVYKLNEKSTRETHRFPVYVLTEIDTSFGTRWFIGWPHAAVVSTAMLRRSCPLLGPERQQRANRTAEAFVRCTVVSGC
jgi:hypothetical protein